MVYFHDFYDHRNGYVDKINNCLPDKKMLLVSWEKLKLIFIGFRKTDSVTVPPYMFFFMPQLLRKIRLKHSIS